VAVAVVEEGDEVVVVVLAAPLYHLSLEAEASLPLRH
jgi:hypothetical protein